MSHVFMSCHTWRDTGAQLPVDRRLLSVHRVLVKLEHLVPVHLAHNVFLHPRLAAGHVALAASPKQLVLHLEVKQDLLPGRLVVAQPPPLLQALVRLGQLLLLPLTLISVQRDGGRGGGHHRGLRTTLGRRTGGVGKLRVVLLISGDSSTLFLAVSREIMTDL